MAFTLCNKCAKNLGKRTVLLQLIIENVVTCFYLEHSEKTNRKPHPSFQMDGTSFNDLE